ncbi:CapA family protein [Micromonospora chersina]|uniref:CapA family protein n=1 Tax=Micromonospora chersina TaxID=47854 RepID=UPI0033FFCEF5
MAGESERRPTASDQPHRRHDRDGQYVGFPAPQPGNPCHPHRGSGHRKASAQIIVLSTHWGKELVHELSGDQPHGARQLNRDSNIDLIIGRHAHVVQPFEKVGDEWIAYGVGNTLARHAFPVDPNREGVIVRAIHRPGRRHRSRVDAAPR